MNKPVCHILYSHLVYTALMLLHEGVFEENTWSGKRGQATNNDR